jgi:uncharacterized membrane protein (DUF106 family)
MNENTQIKNLELAIDELKKTAKEIKHKRTRSKIEKTIARMEESKNRIKNPKAKRSFKPFYVVTIPFVMVFILLGTYYFSKAQKSKII